jgi:polyphosphate kinase
MLTMSMADEIECFELTADNTWVRRTARPDDPMIHLQDALLQRVVGTA